ncbi:response regulator [Glaciecola sp. XM2]|jgi:DNA-binding NarL/FixJ family response regulator|uniref:tetratricopeptide repeat protein n=1 Tax=Glaciecola sp. XM2 TaxID=1914931 RepID=UPI001BDE5C33|nr:tetratricopeptide repeat protein [Glaciecola sp. XM2]MBT1451972.1 response regulator [Glaciecola sp. XM2]
MIKLEGYKLPQKANLRIAIVEDNNTARLNLRSHLMSIDGFEISSYSNGKELRNGLRTVNFDMVFIDFHLGQAKNGVEWIQQLIEAKAFKPSMGLFFVTSDSQPQTIGQILDLHPDFILIKPYTMKSLATNVRHYLSARRSLLPALKYMDANRNQMAIHYVNEQLDKGVPKRIETDFIKLKGRLLIIEKRYDEAISLYSSVLDKANGVLWAHWGLIKSEFFTGKWQECQKMLDRLIDESLTKEKAYEWLASVEIGRKNFIHAEQLLDNIRDTDLTIQATRLKVLCYKMQGKTADALALLEKKVQSNLSIKERLVDYAMELARYHLHVAELEADGDNSQSVSAARVMLGKAGRGISDRQSEQQKDNMLALSFLLDDDKPRAERIISESSHSLQLRNANVSSMVDAVKVWFGLGHLDKAKELLEACDNLMLEQESHIDSLIANEVVAKAEKSLGLEKERAISVNEKGMQEYRAQNFSAALAHFYKAYCTFPGVPAFALNLLQCLGDCQQSEYKDVTVEKLLHELDAISLSDKNLIRMDSIKQKFKMIA